MSNTERVGSGTDKAILDAQHEQWQSTFVSRPEMFGVEPSFPARQTAKRCEHEGRRTILERNQTTSAREMKYE